MPTVPPVSEISTLQRVHGTTLLGVLTFTDVDFPWLNCRFVPTSEFAAIKPLFDAELAAIEDDHWDQVYQHIIDLDLQLVNPERDQCIEDLLLHVENDAAWFRY